MPRELWTNNAKGTLAADILAGDLSLSVQVGEGAEFPELTVANDGFFYATLQQGTTIEIVRVTARVGDVFTIVRAQQGTSASAFTTGAAVQLRSTAGALEGLRRGPRLVTANGFSVADFLYQAGGLLDGSAAFTIGAVARLPTLGNGMSLVSSGSQFISGYAMTVNITRPLVQAADTSFTKWSTSFTPPVWPGYNVDEMGLPDYKSIVQVMTWDGTRLTMHVNTMLLRDISPGNGTYQGGGTGMYVGVNANGGLPGVPDLPFLGGIAGVAYADQVLDLNSLREWSHQCMEEHDVVTGGLAWDSMFSFKQLGLRHGDAVPATVEDLIGSSDLTLLGSLSVREEFVTWM